LPELCARLLAESEIWVDRAHPKPKRVNFRPYLLDLQPGPQVGAAMRYLLDVRLDEGLLGEEEITRRLTEWWRSRM